MRLRGIRMQPGFAGKCGDKGVEHSDVYLNTFMNISSHLFD